MPRRINARSPDHALPTAGIADSVMAAPAAAIIFSLLITLRDYGMQLDPNAAAIHARSRMLMC